METNEIKELIELLKDTDYRYVEIKHEGSQLILSKEAISAVTNGSTIVVDELNKNDLLQKTEAQPVKSLEVKIDAKLEETKEDYYVVKSPMVGTFYAASSPENPPYVKKGDKVKKGDTLCIIEAMKLMNEIESDVEGEIIEILVCNEAVVEYNQPLFKIKTV